jgi:hypothetical protein
MNKIATISFAVLMLGSSAALAQPYGYGGDEGYNRYGEHYMCGRNLANVVNYIIDPASGRPITQAEYQARYPWTNPSTWTYDCASNLWTDHTSENQGYAQNYGRHRGRDHYRR